MSRTLTALLTLFAIAIGTPVVVPVPSAFAEEATATPVDAAEANVDRQSDVVYEPVSADLHRQEPVGTVAGRVVMESVTGTVGYVGGAYVGLIAGALVPLLFVPSVWFDETPGLFMASVVTATATGAILGGTSMVVGTGHLFGVREKNIGATALGFALPTLAGAAALGLAHTTGEESLEFVSLALWGSAPVIGSLTFEHTSGTQRRHTSVAFQPNVDGPGGTFVLNHTF